MMDWIERIFHVDPDGGDGSLEMLILVTVVIVVMTTVLVRRRRKRRKALHSDER